MKRLIFILSFVLTATAFSQAQVTRTTTSIASEIIVKTYPVPATSFINIELEKNNTTNYSLIIYNFLGRKMYEKQKFAQRTTILLDEFSRGVYIYHLADMNGKLVKSGKFQVSK